MGGHAGAAGGGGSGGAAASEPSDVVALRLLATNLAALVEKRLDPAIEPTSLFDIDIEDERAIAVELERLQRLLSARTEQSAAAAPAPSASRKIAHRPVAAGRKTAGAGGKAAGGAGGSGGAGGGGGGAVAADEALLKARFEVDAKRLAFFQLAQPARKALLVDHRKRQEESASAKAKKGLSEAERERQVAATDQRRALEEAKQARSEAGRLVAEERARLLGIKGRHAEIDAELIKERQRLGEFAEQLLTWQRRSDEILKSTVLQRPASPEQVDALYDGLVVQLSKIRGELAGSVESLDVDQHALPPLGDDPLGKLAIEVEHPVVDALRTSLLETHNKLLQRQKDLRWERMRQLMKGITSLDLRRLALIERLSDQKQDKISGFGSSALTQATSELKLVSLLLRYHYRETQRVVSEFRETGEAGGSGMTATITALKWMLPIGLFIWWRRRAERVLRTWKRLALEATQKNRRARGPSPTERALAFFSRVRLPLEWLLLVWSVMGLLPQSALALLEVQIAWTVLSWTLGGQLVVNVIDALFAERRRARGSKLQTAHLRLRTLRLLGRLVVTFGLLLALTSQLVGKGTIYSWVLQLCWFAGVPFVLVVVRWWQHIIFHHLDLQRKKGPILSWVAAHQAGWRGLLSAMIGGVYLLGHRVGRFMRTYVLSFDVVKRVLAYWFRREVAKQSEARSSQVHDVALADEAYAALDPELPPAEVVPSVADAQLEEIVRRVKGDHGAVYAVVGERGSGKSTLLRRFAERVDTLTVTCPPEGRAGFMRALAEVLDVPPEADEAQLLTALGSRGGNITVLVDDAHHLIRPVVDGLADVDAVTALARSATDVSTWVLSFDSVLWQYYLRAREVRPLFDDIIKLRPWSEEGIVGLLASRSKLAGIEPDFARLVGELPPNADELDVEEALERARAGYYRLLWDYSLGNPAVSMHFWRASLRCDQHGGFVVRLFEPPGITDLERLPDSTLLVLRAVIQLGQATLEDIVDATFLELGQVKDAIRYALGRRYLEEEAGRYQVRWTWFRTVTRFLARRHLLMGPYR